MRKFLSLVFFGHLSIYIRHLLTNRTFRVRVGDTLSPSFDQIEGVSQGGVLSVLCFALAINNIVTAVPDGVEWLDFAVCSPSHVAGDQWGR